MRIPHAPASRPALARAATLACLLGVAACGPAYDPLSREGLYYPTHTNHHNLTMMVANPADLVRGTGSASADGQLAAAAVDRLRNDKVKRLPASDIATLSAGTSGDNSSAGSGAP